VLFLDEVYPWQVHLDEKFVQVFEQQSFILFSDIYDTQSSIFFFAAYTIFHAALGGFLAFISAPCHRQFFLNLSSCLMTAFGNSREHI
jgi:hypothetical protein